MTEPYHYRNPDGSLRLDELLGERYVRHYTGILSSSNDRFAAMQLALPVPVDTDDPDWDTTWNRAPRGAMTDDGWMVTIEGSDIRSASSCQDLVTIPQVVWDVCGYYRRLGFRDWRTWGSVTKRQIRAAALTADPGRNDRRIAYATDQLLDPVIRRAYDLMPLGGLFLGDRDVRETIERAAAMAASRQNADAVFAEDETTQAEVLKEWGFDKGISEDEARERLSGDFRHGDTSDALGSTMSAWERWWGWYRMSDPYDDDPYHDDPDAWGHALGDPGGLLEAWQAMVATALTAAGIRMNFSVGIWSGHGARSWQDSNQSCIFFIGKGPVTQQKATEAVRGFVVRSRIREKSS
jgi:hypothetical protein